MRGTHVALEVTQCQEVHASTRGTVGALQNKFSGTNAESGLFADSLATGWAWQAVTGGRMLREEVTETDIADIISQWTGIPVTKLVASERDKLLHLDEELHRRVIGQDEAVNAVADAIQRCAPDQALVLPVANPCMCMQSNA